MRRPDNHRTVAICMTLAGVASGFAATRVEAVPPEMTLPMVLAVAGLMLTVFGLAYTVHASIQAARYARLVRGEGVIARWTVNPHLWRDFREATGAKPRPRPDGVEVIVGEASSLVDGDFQSTPVRGGTWVEGLRWIEGTAPYLELTMKTSGKSGPVTWYHHIPLAAGGTDDGRRVYDHYAAALAGVDRRSIAARSPIATSR